MFILWEGKEEVEEEENAVLMLWEGEEEEEEEKAVLMLWEGEEEEERMVPLSGRPLLPNFGRWRHPK